MDILTVPEVRSRLPFKISERELRKSLPLNVCRFCTGWLLYLTGSSPGLSFPLGPRPACHAPHFSQR